MWRASGRGGCDIKGPSTRNVLSSLMSKRDQGLIRGIDTPAETWTKTNMAPLRGWGRRGDRVQAKAPFGHWNTMTFLAALRHDRIDAPWVFDVEPWKRHWSE